MSKPLLYLAITLLVLVIGVVLYRKRSSRNEIIDNEDDSSTDNEDEEDFTESNDSSTENKYDLYGEIKKFMSKQTEYVMG